MAAGQVPKSLLDHRKPQGRMILLDADGLQCLVLATQTHAVDFRKGGSWRCDS